MGIKLNALMQSVKKKVKETVFVEAQKGAHNITDRSRLYSESKSFADFLPFTEWLDDHEMLLMDDLVSVGCGWEVEMVPSESKPMAELEKIEEAIFNALDNITQHRLVDGQYVLSSYLSDDYSLGSDLDEIKASIHPAWEGSPLADAYIDSLTKMFRGLESEQGLFREGSEGSLRPFRGNKRIPRLFLYRRVPRTKRNGSAKFRALEIEELDHIRVSIEDAIGGLGVKLHRIGYESFFEFMVRWFNPNPASTSGSVNELLRLNPCPPKEIRCIEGELAMSFLYNTPKTNSTDGVIEFDGCPSRFIQVDRISKVPEVAMVTAERKSGSTSDFMANFDLLPSGTMFVKHIFFQVKEDALDRVQFIENKSRFADDGAALVNEEARNTIRAINQGAQLFKTEMGFYITAKNLERLDKKSRTIGNIAMQKFGLGVIEPSNNLFPVESYLRNLPFVNDPTLDNRRRRGRQSWLHQSVSLLPFIGRKRGNSAAGDKRCMTTFNRGGEIINIDPLNKVSNAHMVLLGPTGTGKSATLNKTIIELLIFHNARLVIAEAGLSFDPIMDFLEAQNADVQRININAGKSGRPIAPFANARKARDRFVADMKKSDISESVIIEEIVSKLPSSVDTENVERIVREMMNDETPVEKLSKDYLGECVMIAKVMVTGGDPKEEAEFRLRDKTHLAACIINAVAIADTQNEELVRPSHVQEALRVRAEDESLPIDKKMRARLLEMADCMGNYTVPGDVRSDVLNKPADSFRKCDCLHVELGIAQRDGYEDVLALAYLGLLNNINDIAERKELEGDDRPIYVITDEAHLILKHPMLAPIAIKIVRMWRKYGAWFLPATQDTSSFINGAEAILVIGEMFICLSPPEDEIETLTKLLNLTAEQVSMIRTAKMVEKTYTEGVFFNRQRKTATLFRLLQPSFCLSLAGTNDDEKQARRETMNKYNVRMAGASVIDAAKLDLVRGIISEEELAQTIELVANDPVYKAVA